MSPINCHIDFFRYACPNSSSICRSFWRPSYNGVFITSFHLSSSFHRCNLELVYPFTLHAFVRSLARCLSIHSSNCVDHVTLYYINTTLSHIQFMQPRKSSYLILFYYYSYQFLYHLIATDSHSWRHIIPRNNEQWRVQKSHLVAMYRCVHTDHGLLRARV